MTWKNTLLYPYFYGSQNYSFRNTTRFESGVRHFDLPIYTCLHPLPIEAPPPSRDKPLWSYSKNIYLHPPRPWPFTSTRGKLVKSWIIWASRDLACPGDITQVMTAWTLTAQKYDDKHRGNQRVLQFTSAINVPVTSFSFIWIYLHKNLWLFMMLIF